MRPHFEELDLLVLDLPDATSGPSPNVAGVSSAWAAIVRVMRPHPADEVAAQRVRRPRIPSAGGSSTQYGAAGTCLS